MITDYAQMSVKLASLLNDEQTKNAINKALSTYPLYAPKKDYDLIPTREELNDRILKHYKRREIGSETVGRFLEDLESTMCEIMPYYNELFKTVAIMADLDNPFENVDVTETFEETRSETTETTGSTTGEHGTTTTANATSVVEGEGTTNSESTTNGSTEETKTRKFSDTPQNSVSNIDNYLTEHTKEENDTTNSNSETVNGSNTSKTEGVDESESTTTANDSVTTTGNTDITGTTTHTYTKKGNQGVNTYAHDMIEFRTSIRDIVNEIVNDYRLQNLFMLIWQLTPTPFHAILIVRKGR